MVEHRTLFLFFLLDLLKVGQDALAEQLFPALVLLAAYLASGTGDGRGDSTKGGGLIGDWCG